MKILAINGSPKGKKSITYVMVEEFLKGAKDMGAETQHVLLAEKKIHHCMGCLTCWTKTPGVCLFNDDMRTIDTNELDILVYATPLYVDNISGLLKNYLDRRFSSLNPAIKNDVNGEAVHVKKERKRAKILVISNSGYPGQTHFDVLKVLFRRMARNGETELIGEIYRDEGPLLQYDDTRLEGIIQQYKKLLRKAGQEIALNLKISEETQKELEKPLIPYDAYIQNHNELFKKLLTHLVNLKKIIAVIGLSGAFFVATVQAQDSSQILLGRGTEKETISSCQKHSVTLHDRVKLDVVYIPQNDSNRLI